MKSNKIIHQNATRLSLDVLRIWIFGIWLYTTIKGQFQLIGYMPIYLFEPVGFFLRVLPESIWINLLNAELFNILYLILICSLICVVFKVFYIPSAVVSCLLLTFFQALVRSFGGVIHKQLAILYAAYLITLFAIFQGYYEKNGKKNTSAQMTNLYSIPYFAVLVCLLSAYSLMGIHRLLFMGDDIFQSNNLFYWFAMNTKLYSTEFPGDFLHFIFNHYWAQIMCKIGFVLVTFFEIFALFCLVSRSYRICFILYMGCFHIMTQFAMKFIFWEHLLLFILLIDFTHLLSFEFSKE